MLTIFLRSVILYAASLLAMRAMGKRQVGQLQPFELVVVIMIAELAATPMGGVGIPILYGLLPMAALVVCHGLLTALCMKSERVRVWLCGQPTVLVRNGVICEKQLRACAVDLNDLMEAMRAGGILDPLEVGTAVLEPGGNISVFPKADSRPLMPSDLGKMPPKEGLPLPLILDGGECDVGVESTVVSVVGEKPTLFRPGHITLEDLERALGEEVEVSKAILEKLPEGAVVRSPGMKYKHYAPKADVTLLDGTFEQFKAYVDAHAEQNPSCLCFTGEAEKLGVPCVEYGREGDGADQAKHIFRCLRALDEQGDAVVYARCPQKDGLSMAVYNRLIRAAAFRVIKL